MEIHQLRYFVAVAEEGSFSNAAERESKTQNPRRSLKQERADNLDCLKHST